MNCSHPIGDIMSQLSIFTTCCYLQIMGLNPPFGFKASLANQFINKALTFKPKLIILIVPKETERCPLLLSICMFFCCKLISNTFPCFILDRLDKKYPPYELIWQDSQQLAGKVLLDSLLEIHLIFRMLLYYLQTHSVGKFM